MAADSVRHPQPIGSDPPAGRSGAQEGETVMARESQGRLTGDWSKQASRGSLMRFARTGSFTVEATASPQTIGNWEFFGGALLAFLIEKGDVTKVLGSAVIVAPGLAVTATHVFLQDLEMLLGKGARHYLIGLRDDKVQFWHCEGISYDEGDDLALLSIRPNSDPPADRTYFLFGMTTREPQPGEPLTLLGFRSSDEATAIDNAVRLDAVLYASRGPVQQIYYPMRDKLLAPFPAIEVACGSPGGMSGGAALDSNGRLVGVISRSFQTEDGCGPSLASWIVRAFPRKLNIPWPPGIHKEQTTLLDIDPSVIFIEGREAITSRDDGGYEYKRWH